LSIERATNNLFQNAYFKSVIHLPKTVLILLVVLLVGLAAGLPNFKLDASAESLTLENDTDLDAYRDMSRRYDSGDFLVVTFRPNNTLFSEPSLQLLKNLHDDLSQVEGITSVNSILNVPLIYSPMQSLTQLTKKPRMLLDPGVDWNMAKQEFWQSPIYKELILGPDGETTVLQLNIEVDETYIDLVRERDTLKLKQSREGLSIEEQQKLDAVSKAFLDHRTEAAARSRLRVQQVRDIVKKYSGEAQVFVGGVSMIAADMIAFIQSDLVVFGAAVLGFMIFVLAAIFRSVKFVAIPMVCCVTAVLMMLGLISWLDWRLTVISSNFVALLLIITLAIIIHLVVRYREYEQAHPDWSKEQLVTSTIRFMARPCLYTSITTIVAFASLVISDIRPVIDFGWLMTIGLVVALCLSFLILPAALMILPKGRHGQTKTSKQRKAFTLYFSAIVERMGNGILLVSALIFGLSIWGISLLKVENRFVDYFHDSTEIYQGLTVIDNNLGGTISLDILIDSQTGAISIDEPLDDDEGFEDDFDDEFGEEPFTDEFDDDFGEEDPFSERSDNIASYWMTVAGLQRVEWLHNYLDSLPEVGKVQSLATLYKVGRDINGSLNDFELALMQRALSQNIKDVLISPYLSPDGSQARINLRVIDTYPGLERSELVERIRSHIESDAPFELEQTQFTGLLVLYNNMLQSLFSSQILTLGAVFIAIFIMLAILFRSLFLAAVSIVPNIVAAIFVLGTMGWLGIPLDMMTITIAAITVGIGVDDTIHYIHRFKTELQVDGNYLAAMHRSHESIGRAMYYTSIIIIFGFGIMVLSNFIPTIYFGLLTGVAMMAALLGALLLLPQLLLWLKPIKAAEVS
jgi:predicted RND superfamily exporter protein